MDPFKLRQQLLTLRKCSLGLALAKLSDMSIEEFRDSWRDRSEPAFRETRLARRIVDMWYRGAHWAVFEEEAPQSSCSDSVMEAFLSDIQRDTNLADWRPEADLCVAYLALTCRDDATAMFSAICKESTDYFVYVQHGDGNDYPHGKDYPTSTLTPLYGRSRAELAAYMSTEPGQSRVQRWKEEHCKAIKQDLLRNGEVGAVEELGSDLSSALRDPVVEKALDRYWDSLQRRDGYCILSAGPQDGDAEAIGENNERLASPSAAAGEQLAVTKAKGKTARKTARRSTVRANVDGGEGSTASRSQQGGSTTESTERTAAGSSDEARASRRRKIVVSRSGESAKKEA